MTGFDIDAFGASFLSIALHIALGSLLLAIAMAVYRLIRGPHVADRVVALDLMTILGVGFIAAYALLTRQYAYLDVAIAVGLVGFLATVALARFVLMRGLAAGSREQDRRPRKEGGDD
jgi:multicomponent Na+:H+ antiporter subunit F